MWSVLNTYDRSRMNGVVIGCDFITTLRPQSMHIWNKPTQIECVYLICTWGIYVSSNQSTCSKETLLELLHGEWYVRMSPKAHDTVVVVGEDGDIMAGEQEEPKQKRTVGSLMTRDGADGENDETKDHYDSESIYQPTHGDTSGVAREDSLSKSNAHNIGKPGAWDLGSVT